MNLNIKHYISLGILALVFFYAVYAHTPTVIRLMPLLGIVGLVMVILGFWNFGKEQKEDGQQD